MSDSSEVLRNIRGTKRQWLIRIITFLCFAVLVGAMILMTAPERYDLSVGDIAPKTITATKDVIDEITTSINRQKAADAVQPVYQEDESALETVMVDLTKIFGELEAVRQYGEMLRTGQNSGVSGEEFVYNGSFLRMDIEKAKTLCKMISLSDWQTTILMKLDAESLSNLLSVTENAVQLTMEATIREGQLETAITTIQKQVILYTSSDLCWNIAVPAVRVCLIPNMVVNQEATEENRQAARDAVEPSIYKSGQNIVVAGERVNSAQLAVLETLGLLTGNRFDINMMTGVVLLAVLVLCMLLFFIRQFDTIPARSLHTALLLTVILLVSMGMCVLFAQIHPYFAPISMTVLLVVSLVSARIAVIFNLVAAVLAGVLTGSTASVFARQCLSIILSAMLSGFIGIYMMNRRRHRSAILLSGVAIAVTNFATIYSLGLLTNSVMTEVLFDALWASAGGMLSALMTMGLQPVLEYIFNLATPYKLIEISNPNQPLLRQLLTVTPGTYHHSIMVANLAEAAADAVGANTLLVRAGSYYHDIGKLKRPLYFKENQIGENPHDQLTPEMSAAIITAHPLDGVELARQARLPNKVIDCIAQHHGDTSVAYFLAKAQQNANGETVDENNFRYLGPRPQSAEAGIIMLADTVEAAVRALSNKTQEQIAQRVQELVKAKAASGQLDDTPLTYRDVSRICEAFNQVLTGIYHKRVEYPKLEEVRKVVPAKQEDIKTASLRGGNEDNMRGDTI